MSLLISQVYIPFYRNVKPGRQVTLQECKRSVSPKNYYMVSSVYERELQKAKEALQRFAENNFKKLNITPETWEDLVQDRLA